MKSAGLFVDYESTYSSLQEATTISLSHEAVARHLSDLASAFGQVVARIAWADWDRWPGAQRTLARMGFETRFVVPDPGEPNAVSGFLETELLKVSSRSDALDVVVVASTSPSLGTWVTELRRRGKEMVILAREETVPQALRSMEGVLEPLSLPAGGERDAQPAEAPSPGESTSLEQGPGDTMLERVRTALVAVLSERRLPWISFRLFCDHLASSGVTDAGSARYWIERAVAEGYVRRERERGAARQFYKFTPGRLPPGRDVAAGEVSESKPYVSLFAPRGPAGADTGRKRERRDKDAATDGAAQVGRGGWGQDWRNFTFVRMLWTLRETLEGRPDRYYLNASTMVEALQGGGIGKSEEEVFFWVNQAVDRGLLDREVRESDRAGMHRVNRYYLNHQHSLVTLAEVVPGAIVQTIDLVLRRRTEWNGIAFNFLIRLLRVHPALSNPVDAFHVYRLREWINFLIGVQVLAKFEEPDLRDPSRKTTMVTNNLEHPQTLRFLNDMPDTHFFQPEHQAVLRTILMIDHFLYWLRTKSPDEDWLPLMTLKSWLRNALGDQLTKWSVTECEEQGIFSIDRYRNKGGGDATVAGVRLAYSHPLVMATLSHRDHFLKLLIGLLRDRASVPYGVIEKQMSNDAAFGETSIERLGWFALMIDAKVITVEEVGAGSADRGAGLVCRLNEREKFVGELVTRVIRGEGYVPSRRVGDLDHRSAGVGSGGIPGGSDEPPDNGEWSAVPTASK